MKAKERDAKNTFSSGCYQVITAPFNLLQRLQRQGNRKRCNKCEENMNVRLLRLFQPNEGPGEASAVAYSIQARQGLHHNEAVVP